MDDSGGHGRRKKDYATLLAAFFHYRFYVLDKSHVEHLVGLVENQELDARNVEGPAAEVVEDATRRADDYVDSGPEAAELLAIDAPP